MLHAPGLKGLIIFLVVAGIIVPLFHRARISTVFGFLLAGALLSPHAAGRFIPDYPWLRYVTFDDPAGARVLAEFGIVILLFLLGLELSLKRLWELRRYVLGVGLLQVVLTALAIGMTLRIAGAVPPAGLVLGLCFALSSTAIVMQLLTEQHQTAQPVGRIALSVLLFQDMMVVPILFTVGLLVSGAAGGIFNLIAPFAQALAVVIAIMLAGRFVVRPLLRSAVRTGSRDLIIAITLLILVVFSAATALAGLSVALGAFLAGLLLSDSEARHQIEVDLEPFKGLLLGIFFITVGAALDLRTVAGDLGWIALCVVALIAVKAAILFGVARAFGIPTGNAIEVSLLLAQAGEFAFVVLAQAGDLVPPRLAAGAIAVAALTMLLTPLLAVAARRLAQRFADRGRAHDHLRPREAIDLEDHIVIGGHGRVGAMIAHALEAEKVPYVVLDTDPEAILGLRKRGRSAYFGDAGRPELLRRIGAERARAFVVTVNDSRGAEKMVAAARHIQKDAIVFARAKDAAHARRLTELGAQAVVPETVEASLQLMARLLEAIDLPEEAVTERITNMRTAEIARQASSATE